MNDPNPAEKTPILVEPLVSFDDRWKHMNEIYGTISPLPQGALPEVEGMDDED